MSGPRGVALRLSTLIALQQRHPGIGEGSLFVSSARFRLLRGARGGRHADTPGVRAEP